MALINIEDLETSQDEILQRMLGRISNTEDKTPKSLIYDSLSNNSIELGRMNDIASFIYSKFDVNNLDGDDLATRIRDLSGEERNEATCATGEVTFKGNNKTVIPEGTLVSDGLVQFRTLVDGVIENGEATLPIICEEFGSIGTLPPNSITVVNTVIPGISEITNKEETINGYDAESDEDFRFRFWDKLKYPGKAGNLNHYRIWAMDISGIGLAKTIRCYNGPLSVKVILVDTDRRPVNAKKVQEVRTYIEKEMPFGVDDLAVVSATPFNVEIKIKLELDNESYIEDIKGEIEEKLKEHFSDIGFTENYISYAKVGAIIFSVDGVKDYSLFTINEDNKNIKLKDDETPVLGSVTVL